jgi:hypothetical protein
MDKGNRNAHRYSMSGLKVQETEKWGRATAAERYGAPRSPSMKAKDASAPQSPENKHGPNYRNEVSPSSWLRGGGESAEGKPSYGKIQKRR